MNVSVPLRGKEGAGPWVYAAKDGIDLYVVSVPLRGKEGAGHSVGVLRLSTQTTKGFRPLAG